MCRAVPTRNSLCTCPQSVPTSSMCLVAARIVVRLTLLQVDLGAWAKLRAPASAAKAAAATASPTMSCEQFPAMGGAPVRVMLLANMLFSPYLLTSKVVSARAAMLCAVSDHVTKSDGNLTVSAEVGYQ